jgi:hypothetical protein
LYYLVIGTFFYLPGLLILNLITFLYIRLSNKTNP